MALEFVIEKDERMASWRSQGERQAQSLTPEEASIVAQIDQAWALKQIAELLAEIAASIRQMRPGVPD